MNLVIRSLTSALSRLAVETATRRPMLTANATGRLRGPADNAMGAVFVRSLFTTSPVDKSIRDVHRAGTKFAMVNSDVMTGTVTGDSYLTVRTEDVDAHLPNAHTLKQLFNGTPFDELPIVYIKSTRNNTIIHVFDYKRSAVMYTSCRMEGFKHARKKTTIAGQTTGVAAGQKLLRRGVATVRVVVRGIGPGRMASVKGIATTGVQVVSISDRTKLPELGKRPRKIRRV